MSWIPSYKKPQSAPEPPTIVQWSTGTDEEIVAMVDAHYQGVIDLHDYWTVGDERTVSLSAMEAMSPLTDTHAAQDVTFVLTNVGGKYLSDGITECAFQVDQKQVLNGTGPMNSTRTNVNGWRDSNRRAWCNSIYYNAIPSTLRPIFKEFNNKSGTGNGTSSGTYETADRFALRAEIEVTGSVSWGVPNEGEYLTWYVTSLNRKKTNTGSSTYLTWWLRSPQTDNTKNWCYIDTNGNSTGTYSNYSCSIAPFGVI